LIELKGGLKNNKMKINFRKISAVLASGIMTVSGAAFAAAANYPAPFVASGNADVAIVYGTGAGVSSLDLIQAGNIQTDLQSSMGTTGTTTTTSGEGDSFLIERTSTKYHVGDNITTLFSSFDEDELPTLLADGKYIDNDNDEFDYTQKITVGSNVQLTMYEDDDDQPVVGFKIPSGETVLTYLLTMADQPLIADLETSDMTLMGKDYYILDQTTSGSNQVFTFLDSAVSTVLSEGETTTIGGKTASIEFIGTNQVKLSIDGEVTNTLGASETYKLKDGSYIGIKDVLYSSKEGSVSKVEFSLGSGKLKITSGSEVQMNDNAVSGLTGTIANTTTQLTSISLVWVADDDLFITEDSEIIMPGFGAVKLSYGGLNYPAEETIEVKQGSETYATLNDFPLKDTEEDIHFLYSTTAGAFVGIGKDSNELLATAASGSNITFDADTTKYFIASWSDGSDAESYVMQFTNFITEGTDEKADLQYLKDGAWVDKKTGVKNADTISIGNVDLYIHNVSNVQNDVIVGNNSVNTNFNTLYSKEGMKVFLPYLAANTSVAPGAFNATALGAGGQVGHNATSFYLTMVEEDKSENKASGDTINLTIGWDSSTTAEVEVSAYSTTNTDGASKEIESTDVFRDFTYSELATELLWNKPTSGQKSIKVMYHGDEVSADVYITSPTVSVSTSTGASSLGEVLVKDSEVASVSTKNLIIVGGSCINSAAASVLGGTYCGAAFTQSTGVGSGEFLIKGFTGTTVTSKLALVVAGYDAADTVNAATYLRTQTVDTAKEYKGTSSTSATMVTTTA